MLMLFIVPKYKKKNKKKDYRYFEQAHKFYTPLENIITEVFLYLKEMNASFFLTVALNLDKLPKLKVKIYFPVISNLCVKKEASNHYFNGTEVNFL